MAMAAGSTFSQHIHGDGSWFHVFSTYPRRWQLVPRFLNISTAMQILMLEICWSHFNKFKLKLQIKKYFQQIWYIYVIMFA